MNRIVKLCAGLALAALALESQTPGERVTVPFSDASRPRVLKISHMHGNVTVKGYGGKEAIVEAKAQEGARGRRNRPDPRAEGLRRIGPEMTGLKIEEQDNLITVSAGLNAGDINVQVPFETRLQLKLMNGEITVEGVAGEIDAHNTNGRVTLRNVSGAVVAHSLNDDLTVTFDKVAPDKAMSFSTMNGDIDVAMPAGVKARVKMKTDNGEIYSDFDIRTEPAAGPTATETGKGKRIRFDKTMYGTINGGGPEIQFTTFNGKIYLRQKK
ncbi:MAG TPA: DUF4097 family beta strand repeat-containing protein [Bryobacteraceae bacterium]|nr:DUF4097 family beta strand repeat-containing protein [Bryobacteraceae bacterium]